MGGDRWTVLVLDARPEARRRVAGILEAAEAEVLPVATVNEAFATLIDTPVDLAVVSLELPGASGLLVVRQMRDDRERAIPILLLAPSLSPELVVTSLGEGAADVLSDPPEPLELVARCRSHLATSRRVKMLEGEVARLHELAVTDGLTQVANHRFFQERLVDEFRRAQRYDDPLALILSDLDHFKEVNDRYGHQVGDQVLQALAEMLRGAVRETDFVARYGGEEFAVLLPKTHLSGALSVAERICAELRVRKIGPLGVQITASFGVSGFPGRGISSADQLLRTADEALYRSKSEGRNRISLYQAAHPPSASN